MLEGAIKDGLGSMRLTHAAGGTQGYALALVPMVAAQVPAAQLVVPCLSERLAACDPSDALFAVALACHLAVQHPSPATHVRALVCTALGFPPAFISK